jgi:hypothetical protein
VRSRRRMSGKLAVILAVSSCAWLRHRRGRFG